MLAKNGDITSVQFSRSVVSDSLRPHGQQHARPPCPSPTPRVRLNPCPSSRWCHPTISSSVVPFSSCPQSFPASGSSPTRKLFASGGQRIGASASTLVFPMNQFSSVQFSSVIQSCPTLYDPIDCRMPRFPVYHQLPELAQTHVHRVGDTIPPSHPLTSPSPPTFNLSKCQGLFQWVGSSYQGAKVLEFQLQHQSFQWIFMTDFL